MSSAHPDWNAVLGHELRTPVAAILGYQELLEDGMLGQIPAPAAEALRRVRFAASQLITLIDAVEGSADGQEPSAFPVHELFDDAISAVSFDAEGRGTRIEFSDSPLELYTHRNDACRALALVLGAAIKVTPGGVLHIAAGDSADPHITVSGATLDAVRDRLDPDRPLTGAGLRLELAAAAAARIRGTVALLADGTVRLVLPRLLLS
ncbi:MAG TPA: histidine kinase dimerization/phospho-acceptor domain-containing protein [Longimicrobiales bacterium]|nr:histidine kinase dimerization/phospho-acceptor domain-containing protein [Longimicrobiales bacterium]